MIRPVNLSCFLLLLLTFLASGFASPSHRQNDLAEKTEYSVNFDKMFDRFLPIIQKAMLDNNMDPQELPDFSERIVPLPGRLQRDIDFTQGWLQEMSKLTRSGPILVDYGDKIMNLDLNLHWDILDFNYRYFFKLLLISRSGDVYGRFHDLDAHVNMTVDLETHKVTLNTFKFNEVEKLDLRFEGRIGDGIRNALVKAVSVIFRKTVLRIAEEKSFMIFQMMLEEMDGKLPNVFPGVYPAAFP